MHTTDLSYTIHKVVLRLDKRADDILLEKLSLTFSHFRILRALAQMKDATQKDIATYWDMTEAAISRQVDILIKDKLIDKKENPKNRRAYMLSLTNAGKKTYEQAEAILDKEYEAIYGNISLEEKLVLAEAFNKLLGCVCTECDSFC